MRDGLRIFFALAKAVGECLVFQDRRWHITTGCDIGNNIAPGRVHGAIDVLQVQRLDRVARPNVHHPFIFDGLYHAPLGFVRHAQYAGYYRRVLRRLGHQHPGLFAHQVVSDHRVHV
ncbi:hypothetical protein D3C75_1029540 [compost metagenome]